MTRHFKFLIAAVIVVLTSQATLLADVTGSILGVVTDATSAVVQGAKITVTNQDTNQSSQAISDGLGQ
jgi:hypothetical protein